MLASSEPWVGSLLVWSDGVLCGLRLSNLKSSVARALHAGRSAALAIGGDDGTRVEEICAKTVSMLGGTIIAVEGEVVANGDQGFANAGENKSSLYVVLR